MANIERAVGIGQSAARKIRQTPSPMVHSAVHVVVVTPIDGCALLISSAFNIAGLLVRFSRLV